MTRTGEGGWPLDAADRDGAAPGGPGAARHEAGSGEPLDAHRSGSSGSLPAEDGERAASDGGDGFARPSSEARYARQIRFRPIGDEGQRRLGAASAVIAGMGALGCVLAQHLVRAGVGHVRLIDRDIVEWSNLQRQMLYSEDDVRAMLPKAEAAAARLRRINGSVTVESVVAELSAANAGELLEGFDLVLDGTDNFTVRYMLNDYCVRAGIPWIYGAAVGSSGMTMTIRPGTTPCYRCLFPAMPEGGLTDTCETAGVISPIVDTIASLQAAEALKLLSGRVDKLSGRLLQADLWDTQFTSLDISHARRADCPACGLGQFPYLEAGSESAAASLCGRETIQLTPARPQKLLLDELAVRLAAAGPVRLNPFLLRLELEEERVAMVLFPDGRALFQGTEDMELARRLYRRLMAV